MTTSPAPDSPEPPRTLASRVHQLLPASIDERATRAIRKWKGDDPGRAADDRGGVSTRAFFTLAFGREPSDDDGARLDGMFASGVIESPRDARRLLSSFDAQAYPTPFLVRATADGLRCLTLDGFKLWVDDSDPSVSTVIAHQSDWEPHVTAALAPLLQPGASFVDVGANVGFHTFLAASRVGATGSVLAVEPSSENCRLLRLSQLENDADNVTIAPFAFDREVGVRYLSSHIGTNAGLVHDARDDLLAGRGTPIYATTLDRFAPERVDVLKIDVEGAELRVLDGARETLARDRPTIVMEFSCEMIERVSEVEPRAALQEILDLGYALFLLDRTTRAATPFGSAEALLADWNDPFRIEDLLLRPV